MKNAQKIQLKAVIDEVCDGEEATVRIKTHFYNADGQPLAHDYEEDGPDIEPQLDVWRQGLKILWLEDGHKIDSHGYEVRFPGLTLAHKDIGAFITDLIAAGIVVEIAGVTLAFDEIMSRREDLGMDEVLGVDR